jgi:hypothetical protein
MRTAAGEQQIAAVAIGDERDQADLKVRLDDPPPTALPPGIVVGDLRSAARGEAARLENVRRLIQHGRVDTTDARPCVTVLASRHTRSVNDWVYRLIVEDLDLQPLWITLLGIRESSPIARSNGAIRRRIDLLTVRLESALTPAAQRVLSAFREAAHTPRSLAVERERAIAESVRQERARMASFLLQPGLFDRRAERAAAAQNATLGEALERCERRLDELHRDDPVSLDRRLAFGVIRR